MILSLIFLLLEITSSSPIDPINVGRPCVDNACDQGFLIPPRYPLNSSIAIIGSGMSGILSARKLAQFGYTNITIFEKQGSLGGYTQSYFLDGEYFDFHAHLVASRFFGSHLHPETQKLLEEIPFSFRKEWIKWRNSTDTILPLCLMEIAAGLVNPDGTYNFTAVEQFVMGIIETQEHLTQAYWGQLGEGGSGSIKLDGMDLTWQEYSKSISPVEKCLDETLATAANMRRLNQTAAFIVGLNSLLHLIAPTTLAEMLEQVSEAYPEQWSKVLPFLPNSLRLSLIHSNCYAATEGWNNWMMGILNHLTAISNINILPNTQVTKLTGGDTVIIEDSTGQIYNFDVAIITSRPKDTRQFVQSPDLKDLFSEDNCPTVWTRSVLVESEYPIEPRLPESGLGFWILEPYATLTGTDPEAAQNFFTACNKQNPHHERWMCFSNSQGPDEITPEEAWKIGQTQLKEFGFGNSKHLTEYLSNWPVFPAAGNNWYRQAATLQGVNNIFFGGEVMSGPTIESIIDYTYKAIPQWFSIVQKP